MMEDSVLSASLRLQELAIMDTCVSSNPPRHDQRQSLPPIDPSSDLKYSNASLVNPIVVPHLQHVSAINNSISNSNSSRLSSARSLMPSANSSRSQSSSLNQILRPPAPPSSQASSTASQAPPKQRFRIDILPDQRQPISTNSKPRHNTSARKPSPDSGSDPSSNQSDDSWTSDSDSDTSYDSDTEMNRNKKPTKPKKLPSFDGQSNFMDWINTYEDICDYNHQSRRAALRISLKGNAKSWYRRSNITKTTPWKTIKTSMTDEYGETQEEIIMELMAAKQGRREKVKIYYNNLAELAMSVSPPIANDLLLAAFIHGLNKKIRKDVALKEPSTISEAYRLARKIEKLVDNAEESEEEQTTTTRSSKSKLAKNGTNTDIDDHETLIRLLHKYPNYIQNTTTPSQYYPQQQNYLPPNISQSIPQLPNRYPQSTQRFEPPQEQMSIGNPNINYIYSQPPQSQFENEYNQKLEAKKTQQAQDMVKPNPLLQAFRQLQHPSYIRSITETSASNQQKKTILMLSVSDQYTPLELDSASDYSCLSLNTYNTLKTKPTLHPVHSQLLAANNQPLTVLGAFTTIAYSVEGFPLPIAFAVVKELTTNVIGRDILGEANIDNPNHRMVYKGYTFATLITNPIQLNPSTETSIVSARSDVKENKSQPKVNPAPSTEQLVTKVNPAPSTEQLVTKALAMREMTINQIRAEPMPLPIMAKEVTRLKPPETEPNPKANPTLLRMTQLDKSKREMEKILYVNKINTRKKPIISIAKAEREDYDQDYSSVEDHLNESDPPIRNKDGYIVFDI